MAIHCYRRAFCLCRLTGKHLIQKIRTDIDQGIPTSLLGLEKTHTHTQHGRVRMPIRNFRGERSKTNPVKAIGESKKKNIPSSWRKKELGWLHTLLSETVGAEEEALAMVLKVFLKFLSTPRLGLETRFRDGNPKFVKPRRPDDDGSREQLERGSIRGTLLLLVE